jgi:hypothetical protein
MIRKTVQRFSEKIMSNKKAERDDDSTKTHPALAVRHTTDFIDEQETFARPCRP